MPDIELTQSEADALLEMDKRREAEMQYEFPIGRGTLKIPLVAVEYHERFFLDIYRSHIALKAMFQNRARTVIILARLDLMGSPHRNPDGQSVDTPHLHLYREGFGDKWATPIAPAIFTNVADLHGTLDEFMAFCRIVEAPNILRTLI